MVTRVSRYGRWSVKPSKRDRYPLVTPRYTGPRLTVPMIRTKVFNIVAGVHIVYNTEDAGVGSPHCLESSGDRKVNGSMPSSSANFGSMMEDIEKHIDTKEFKDLFWHWFDDLPLDQRRQFNYYKLDVAKINFYNTEYRFRLRGSNG